MTSPTLAHLTSPHNSPQSHSHFVQALHDFFPTNAPSDNTSACLFFQRGAIIEVYNRDELGWWDGVTDGLRGWFPSNYVGRLGELRRHSADYEDIQDTPQLQEFEAWRQGLISTTVATASNNLIETNGSDDLSVLPTTTTQYALNVTGAMSQRSYSEASNTSIDHNPDQHNDDDPNHEITNDHQSNRLELARAILDEDRQKFETIPSAKSISNKNNSPPNLDYLMEDANNRISDLVEDCGQRHLYSNIQLVIFQVVSSIRSVLTAANTVSKDSPLLKSYPELARQRKNVLSSLSKLVLKGKELQALFQVEDDYVSRRKVQDDVPTLANQLLMDMGLFENVLRSILPSLSSPELSDDDYDDDVEADDDQSDGSSKENGSYSLCNNLSQSLGEYNTTQGTLDSFDSSNTLRQQLVAARLSSASLIAKVVPLSDAQHIIQTIVEHQTCIGELIDALLIIVEEFLAARQRATHMLEVTRKTVEAVRTFLAVVEHVCSNVGDLDYKQYSVIPEDPHLVALVLAKEAVYSSITNLVTAVRALTGPRCQQTEDIDDLLHLQTSCANVVRTTNDCASCVRICLYVDDPSLELPTTTPHMDSLDEMRNRLESSVDTRRNQTLSILGRKVTSLNALQRRYTNNDTSGESDHSSITITAPDNHSNGSINIGNESDISTEKTNSITVKTTTDTQDIMNEKSTTIPALPPPFEEQHLDATNKNLPLSENVVENLEIRQRQPAISSSEPSSSSSSSVAHDIMDGYQRHRTHSIPSVLSETSQSRSSLGGRSNRSLHGKVPRNYTAAAQRRSQATSATSRSSYTTSISSIHTNNGTAKTLSDRSSVDSFNMTPLTTPEAMSPVNEYDDDIPSGQHMLGKLDPLLRQNRQRSSSINTLAIVPPSNHQSLVAAQRMPLPPIPPSPMEPPPDVKPTSSKSTPTLEQSTSRTRRPRGMSVSTFRMSIKQKQDDQRVVTEVPSKDSLGSNNKTINRISSRSSMGSTDQSTLHDVKHDQEPWFLKQRKWSDDEVIVNADGHLTGATIEALIEKLTLHEKSPDLVFTRAFFYNFRLFTTPSAFVDLLIQRFRLSPPSDPVLSEEEFKVWKNRVLVPVRLRVYNVIKTWLETYYRYEQDGVESQLTAFATEDMQAAMPGPAKRMIDLIQRTFEIRGHSISHRKMSYAICSTSSSHSSTLFGVNGSNVSLSEYNPLRPPLQTKNSSGHLSLSSGSSLFSDLSLFGNDSHNSYYTSSSSLSDQLHYPPINLTRSLRNALRKAVNQNALTLVHINDFDCMELARQFTLMESALFCQITPYEMIGQEFKKKVGQSTAVHVKAMIQKSTHLTSWISDSILREQDAKRRAQMIKFWIKVGDCCLQMNNYNTLMAIRSALDSTSIRRLKKTWDHLSAKYKHMLEPIYRATDSSRNFAEYRTRLKTAVAPCLPFLGVYLTDMTFIDDGNSNHRTTPSGQTLINFDKYIKTTKVLNEIDQFQIPYKLLEVEEIQRYLSRCLETVEKDEQAFYNRSITLEPRQEDASASDIRHTISQFT
ncbi:unnamed protein product [Absidia cylindrospora]